MADTDDDQTLELAPDQHVQGDDDTEAAGERRTADARERDGDEHLAAVVGLTEEEAAAHREQERDERLATDEIDASAGEAEVARINADERALEENRLRKEVQAAETARAIELAHIAESAANRHRRLADAQTQQATSDWAHGNHLLDEAAAGPDEPGADATAAAGRRYQRAADREDRGAAYDDRLAHQYDADARDYRNEARQQAQPDPVEAVRNPPATPPEARTRFVRSRLKKLVRDRSTQPDIGLGD